MNASWEALEIETVDGIATVTMKGPGRGNAMGPDLWDEMPRAFSTLDTDDDVRVVILRGAGNNFSYGLDLHASGELMAKITGENNLAGARTDLLDMIGRWQKAFNVVESCRKPVVAMIDGWCIGGGVDLIAACDVRIAARRATFSVREVKLAIVPDLGSLQRLPALIGEGQTRRLALSGEDIDAEDAARIGLVERIVPVDALEETVHDWAAEVAGNPPLVVQGIKRVLNQARVPAVEAGLDYVATWNAAFLQSKDLSEAITAFMERRPPEFTGE